jgi:hypothetical protein
MPVRAASKILSTTHVIVVLQNLAKARSQRLTLSPSKGGHVAQTVEFSA